MFECFDQAIKFWKSEYDDNSDPKAPVNKQSILYLAYSWVQPPEKAEPEDKMEKFKQSHRFKRQPSEEQVKKKLATLEQRLKTFELQMKNKDDNKSVALGTSKINYMDPRVTVAWCKRNECPIDKVFPRALRDKFPWAMSEKTDYKF